LLLSLLLLMLLLLLLLPLLLLRLCLQLVPHCHSLPQSAVQGLPSLRELLHPLLLQQMHPSHLLRHLLLLLHTLVVYGLGGCSRCCQGGCSIDLATHCSERGLCV
jgi:hypothetical protein